MVGDIDANVERVRLQLRHMQYPVQQLDLQGLKAGRPVSFLPVLHFAVLDFSPPFAIFLSECGEELRSKSDLRFIEALYRVLREHLGYNPVLSVNQFFSQGFAERKVLLCQDILQAVLAKHEELTIAASKATGRTPPVRRARRQTVDAQEPTTGGSLPSSTRASNVDTRNSSLGQSLPEHRTIVEDLRCSSDSQAWQSETERSPPVPSRLEGQAHTLNAAADYSGSEHGFSNIEEAEANRSEDVASDVGSTPQGELSASKLGSLSAEVSLVSQVEDHCEIPGGLSKASLSPGKIGRADQCHVPANAQKSGSDPLVDLLEDIRSALGKRFDELERRFEEHVEAANARSTLLEGEVRILAAKLSQTREAASISAPEGKLVGLTSSNLRHGDSCRSVPASDPPPQASQKEDWQSSERSCGLLSFPSAASSMLLSEQLSPKGPEQGPGLRQQPRIGRGSGRSDLGDEEGYASGNQLPKNTTFGTATSSSYVEKCSKFSLYDTGAGGADAVGVSGGKGAADFGDRVALNDSTNNAARSELTYLSSDVGAKDLIEKLSAKFKDTQLLLKRAQEKIHRADLAGVGVGLESSSDHRAILCGARLRTEEGTHATPASPETSAKEAGSVKPGLESG
eukprot:TRINITY_DN5163_c0_g1_i3.p1 TRINITY_DN5163_c0_g1~~TRINITY_DN5163_c0_g1_i3.p1  ORF type:complete len:626 (+),score=131.23 TRINITY_DN5163_c0_g1_i3:105-1982(+)